MKILYLSDEFPPEVIGGAGVIVADEATYLKKRGYDVEVISVTHSKDKEGEIYVDGVKVHLIYSNYSEKWRAYRSLYNPKVVNKVENIVSIFKPDIIHAHNIHSHLSYGVLRSGKKYKAKVFLTLHDVMTVHYGKLFKEQMGKRISVWRQIRDNKLRYNPFRNVVIRYYLGYADKIFAVSDSVRKVVENEGIRNVVTLYNGIDENEWSCDAEEVENFRNTLGLADKKVILFAGRLSGAKGSFVAARALAKIREKVNNAVLLVAGREDTPSSMELKKYAKEIGIGSDIVFTGWLQREEMKKAVSCSDIVMVLSLYLDPFSIINLEAMVSYKPVIGTKYGGTQEAVLDGKTGYIVDPEDTDTVSKRSIELLLDVEKNKKYGLAGYERVVANFSLDRHLENLLKWYNE